MFTANNSSVQSARSVFLGQYVMEEGKFPEGKFSYPFSLLKILYMP